MMAHKVSGRRARDPQEWPNYKLLLPYGDPMNAVIFLKLSPGRDLIVAALSICGFRRLPGGSQSGRPQPPLSIVKDLKQYKKRPVLCPIEGTCVSPRTLTRRYRTGGHRHVFLLVMGYGVALRKRQSALGVWLLGRESLRRWLEPPPVAMPRVSRQLRHAHRHLNRPTLQVCSPAAPPPIANSSNTSRPASSSTCCGPSAAIAPDRQGRRALLWKSTTRTTMRLLSKRTAASPSR